MALAPLATTADLAARSLTIVNPDLALDVASSLIRDAAGCAISSMTSTVTVIGTQANLLRLPGPVTAVASVGINGTTLTTDDYEVLSYGLWRDCGWAWGRRPLPVDIVYTHGLTIVPSDIVDLTCSLAKAWGDHNLNGGGSIAGIQSAGIDDARESYTTEASSQVSPAYIPEATRQWLARRFGSGVEVVETL